MKTGDPTTTEARELLPCPFCGSMPEFGHRTNTEGVACSNNKCNAEGPWVHPCNYHEGMKLWNTRSIKDRLPPSEGVEGMREALEKCRTEIVMALAFLGRDQGTSRIDSTIESLCKGLSEADDAAIRALGKDES